jgi:capsular polysaccharide biosynthesis protein
VRVEKPVRVKGLLIASQSFIVQRGVAEPFFALAETIGHYYRQDEAASSRIYISRRFATKRRMRNEEAIEALFAKHRFKIVHPEQLSVPEQIRLFAGAEWVAGSVGSGLYGSMFSPKNCRRIILAPSHFFTPNDLMLSRTHGPIYLLDERGPKDPKKAIVEDWEIDAFSVKRCLDGLFKKADRAKRLGEEMAAPVSET